MHIYGAELEVKAVLLPGFEGDHGTAMLFPKNVFNRLVELDSADQFNFNLPDFNRVAVGQPLTFGVDLSYRFGH